jgi:hypothetical protein
MCKIEPQWIDLAKHIILPADPAMGNIVKTVSNTLFHSVWFLVSWVEKFWQTSPPTEAIGIKPCITCYPHMFFSNSAR